MTPLRMTIALLLLAGAVVLAAGCIDPQASSSCPVRLNSTPWIAIDNVSDHYVWDDFTITGTTNLDAGDSLEIHVFEREHTCPYGVNCIFYSNTGKVRISEGNCGVNTWRYPINLSGALIRYCKSGPDCRDYHIMIKASDPRIRNYSTFYLLTGPQPRDDPASYSITRGEPFTLNVAYRAQAIRVWLFGKDTVNMMTVPVNSGNFFTIHLAGSRTAALMDGTYVMLLQYPGINGEFGISMKNGTSRLVDEHGRVITDITWVENGIITGYAAEKNFEQAMRESASQAPYLVATLDVSNKAPPP
jgi:hypothetical protein